jgi:histidinol-phosphatase
VARGAGEAMLEPDLNIWDYAALQVVVEEAGGRMSQLDGSPTKDGGSVLTTNGLLHDELISRLAGSA